MQISAALRRGPGSVQVTMASPKKAPRLLLVPTGTHLAAALAVTKSSLEHNLDGGKESYMHRTNGPTNHLRRDEVNRLAEPVPRLTPLEVRAVVVFSFSFNRTDFSDEESVNALD